MTCVTPSESRKIGSTTTLAQVESTRQKKPLSACPADVHEVLFYKYEPSNLPLCEGKGSLQVFGNYCPKNSFCVFELYSKIIIEEAVNETDIKIWDVQKGFRNGMELTNHISIPDVVT
ncbi:hypothetical protein EVAR_12275_1 [Eumeta japonica]|uniref:Uncharacterized protein n=1 Tax=Eumeta variegata TaxID=151549 RepID=A0A4C1TU67_EUMVA|nr:hypothetical protein EVAR_12275_1 [Eumeta japonica]